jgi:hypothetical protein
MATFWVLFYITLANGNVPTATAEFATEARCLQAAQMIKERFSSALIQTRAFCMKKSEP